MCSVRKSSAYSVKYIRIYYIRLRCPMLFFFFKNPFGYFYPLSLRVACVLFIYHYFIYFSIDWKSWCGMGIQRRLWCRRRNFAIIIFFNIRLPSIYFTNSIYIYILILQLMLLSAISPHGALLTKRARCRRRSARLEFLTAV